MKEYNRKDGDNMPVIIEKIICVEHSESITFIKMQQKRLQQLKQIEQRKLEGKKVQKGRIVKELQAAGILDEDGNLSSHYVEAD